MEDRNSITSQQAPPSLEVVYDLHRHGLVRFATVLVGADAAQDVVSAAVLGLLERRRPAEITNPKAYLYQAVANRARNHLRREGRRRAREGRSLPSRPAADLPEAYPEVRAAIERLSVRQRAVVFLTFWEDLHEKTIAHHLGISVGSVRTHLARARRHLKRTLHDHDI